MFAEEKDVEERIQTLLHEDRKLEEQRKRREGEEDELRQKFVTLKAMQQKIRKQAEQRDRIASMKQEEGRLQRQLVEKVQKDREREQRMQELLKPSTGLEEFIKKASLPLPTVAKKETLPTGVQWNNDYSEEAELRRIERKEDMKIKEGLMT